MAFMNLYDLFVANVFGNFWTAVGGLIFVFILILAVGGVSGLSIGVIIAFFLLAMAFGYGYTIITIPLFTAIIAWSVFEVMQYWNER